MVKARMIVSRLAVDARDICLCFYFYLLFILNSFIGPENGPN